MEEEVFSSPSEQPSSASVRSSDSDYTLPASARLLEHNGCTYYLVGTAHVSRESCRDVKSVISKVSPQVVFLELCPERKNLIAERKASAEEPMQQAVTLRDLLSSYRQGQTTLLQMVYGWALGRIGAVLEVAPGEEFRVAVLEAKKVGAKVVLGDRPLQITLTRTWAALSLWHRCTLLTNLLGGGVFVSAGAREEIERMKDGDALTKAFLECSKSYPTLLRPLLHERNEYMAYVLRNLAHKEGVSKVVAVVGYGHLEGLEECWEKDIDIEEIVSIPEKRPARLTWKRAGMLSLCGLAVVSVVGVGLRYHKGGGLRSHSVAATGGEGGGVDLSVPTSFLASVRGL